VVLILTAYFIANTSIFKESRFAQVDEDELRSNRIYIWESAYNYFGYNLLFGLGLGGYEDIRELVIYQRSMHNNYLNIIANVGVIGLILIFSYLFILIFRCYIYLKNNFIYLTPNIKVYTLALIPMMLVLLISSITASWSFSLYTSFLGFIILGMTVKVMKR
jgi:O-antigen ligase